MSKAKPFYVPLEAFRGVSAVAIVFHHSTFVNGGHSALIDGAGMFVDFFFILSGFVMSLAYMSRIDKHAIGFGEFFWLRLSRIYPLHLFILALWLPYIGAKLYVYAQYGIGSDPSDDSNLWSLFLNLLLLHSMGVYDQLSWNYPSWSISVEFYTYLVFFFFVFFVRTKRSLFAFLISLSAGLAILSLAFSPEIERDDILFTYDYGFVRCLFGFFLGVLIFEIHKKKGLSIPESLASVLEVVTIAFVIFLIVYGHGRPLWEFVTVLTFGWVIFLFSGSRGIVSRFVALPPFVFLGKTSYSIYLLHALILALADNIARFVLKMPLAETATEGRFNIDTPYAPFINAGLLFITVICAGWTHRHIEMGGKSLFARFTPSWIAVSKLRNEK